MTAKTVGLSSAKKYRAYYSYLHMGVLISLLMSLTACGTSTPDATPNASNPTSEPITLPESAWGTVELIGQAPQLNAPAFAYTATDRIVSWTGLQPNNLITHYAIGITDERHQLGLPTFYPQQQTLFATNQGALKVWLDRNASESGLRLHASTLDFDGTLQTGIIAVNTQRTRNYDVIQVDTREFRIVASAGLGEITNLYVHQIDDNGRPTGENLLQIDGDHPALLRDNQGQIHLFWLNDNGRNIFQAQFDEVGAPTLINVRRIARTNIDVTDAIIDFSVGYDGSTAYLLWTIRQIDDTRLVLMSNGQLTDERFSTPQRLQTSSGEAVQWATPTQQFQRPLPIVINHEQTLSLMWMDDGRITETEFIAESGRLIGLPQIDTRADRIGVSWAQPTIEGRANLLFVERSRLP